MSLIAIIAITLNLGLAEAQQRAGNTTICVGDKCRAVAPNGARVNNKYRAGDVIPEPAQGFKVQAAGGATHPLTENLDYDSKKCIADMMVDPEKVETNAKYLVDNTLPAIRQGFEMGADFIAITLRVTADNRVVLFHDDNLDCRTKLQGKVSKYRLDQLQQANMAYKFTADKGMTFPWRDSSLVSREMTRIATADEVFSLFGNKQFWIHIDPENSQQLRTIMDLVRRHQQILANSYFAYKIKAEGWVQAMMVEELPQARRLKVDRSASETCLEKFQSGRLTPLECYALDIYMPMKKAKAMADQLPELSQRLRSLASPSRLILGGLDGDTLDSAADAEFAKKNKKYFDGVSTNRIDLVGKSIK